MTEKLSQTMILILIGIFFINVQCLQIAKELPQDPVKIPWPNVWTQSYIWTSYPSQIQSSGIQFYDWTHIQMRYDFNNSKSYPLCFQNILVNTSCTILLKNNSFIIYFPDKKQCCYMPYGGSVPPPNIVLQSTHYNSTVNIGNQQFFKWSPKQNPQIYPTYYTTTTDKQIPRRQEYTQDGRFDFMVSSYSQTISNYSVFDIPSYCKSQNICYTSNNDKSIILHAE